MSRSIALVGLVLALFTAAPAQAERATLTAGAISIEVPTGWSVQNSPNALALTTADGALGIVLAAASDPDREVMWKRLETGARAQVADLALAPRGEGRIGGMVALLAAGPGTMRGTSVSMVLGVITTPAGNHVALMVTSEKPRGKVYAQALQQALDSIAPLADPATGLSASATAFANQLTAAIEANDGKRFLRLLAPRITRAGATVKVAAIKRALARWPAAKGGLAGYLDQPAGDWHVHALGDTMFTLRRGGDSAGAATLIMVQQVKGKWQVTSLTRATLLE